MVKLKPVADRHGAEARQVGVMDAAGLDRLLVGADAVINCAGPFGDTAPPLIEATLQAGIAYLDVTAEPLVTMEVFASYADAARAAGVVVAPAFGFLVRSAICWRPPRWGTGIAPSGSTSLSRSTNGSRRVAAVWRVSGGPDGASSSPIAALRYTTGRRRRQKDSGPSPRRSDRKSTRLNSSH